MAALDRDNNGLPINPFGTFPSVPQGSELIKAGQSGHQPHKVTKLTLKEVIHDLVHHDVISPDPVFVKIGMAWYPGPDCNIVLSFGNDQDDCYFLNTQDPDYHMVQLKEYSVAGRVQALIEKVPDITGAWIQHEESGCAGFVIGPIYPKPFNDNDDQEQLSDILFGNLFEPYAYFISVFQITSDGGVKQCFQDGRFPFHPWPELETKLIEHDSITVTPELFVKKRRHYSNFRGTAFGKSIGDLGDFSELQWWLFLMSARVVTGDQSILAEKCGKSRRFFDLLKNKGYTLISAYTHNGGFFTFVLGYFESGYDVHRVQMWVGIDDADGQLCAEAVCGGLSWCHFVDRLVGFAHENAMVDLHRDG